MKICQYFKNITNFMHLTCKASLERGAWSVRFDVRIDVHWGVRFDGHFVDRNYAWQAITEGAAGRKIKSSVFSDKAFDRVMRRSYKPPPQTRTKPSGDGV